MALMPVDISVILPVYNAGSYLRAAIDSVLDQTYKSFELIVINDGSTDDSKAIIDAYNDPRIVPVHQANKGLAATLNTGIAMAKGEFIARQDADDISYPERFEKQIAFLRKHPQVQLLGTQARIITADGQPVGAHRHASQYEYLLFDLMFNNPFVHSSVMIRKNVFESMPAYTTDKGYFEDYELWSRIAFSHVVANLPQPLLDYRHHDAGISTAGNTYYKSEALYNQNFLNAQRAGLDLSEPLKHLFYLWNGDMKRYHPQAKADLLAALTAIKDKLSELPHADAAKLGRRFAQYTGLLNYRLICQKKDSYKNNPLLRYYTMFKQKLFRYPHQLTND